MKIEDGNELSKLLIKMWFDAADQLSFQYGIHVSAKYHVVPNTQVKETSEAVSGRSYIKNIERIYYKVGERQFETLNEVKRALEMKEFM